MHINIYKKEDSIGELNNFCREMILASYYPAYSRDVVELFLRYHDVSHIAQDAADGRIWCAYEDGKMVGTVTVANSELSRMFVSPAMRGRGLGWQLVGEALGWARDTGVKKLTAWSVPFSRGFYEKLGFCTLNADVTNFDNTRDPAVPYIEMALWPEGQPDVAILAAEECDIAEMLEGQRAAFEEQCRIYDDWDIPPMKEMPEDLAGFMRAGGIVLKACAGGRIIGAIRGKVVEGVCHVGRLYMADSWQGRSIARRMISRLEEISDCRLFSIFTGERSEKNLALYMRQGYAPTGKRAPAKEPGSAGNYDLVWLEKPNPWPQIAECARRFQSS